MTDEVTITRTVQIFAPEVPDHIQETGRQSWERIPVGDLTDEAVRAIGQDWTERLLAVDQDPDSWLGSGRDFGESFYSPLDSINRETAGRLGREDIAAMLRDEIALTERHEARARAAAAESLAAMHAIDSMHMLAHEATCSAHYSIPTLQEVADANPRTGLAALTSIAQRIADRGPALRARLAQALARVEGLHD